MVMENEIADLSISDGEEDVWQIMEDDKQMTLPHMFDLVGYFSTACVVHFQAMRNTMANIWHLLRDFWVQILDLPYGLMMEVMA
ncbi:hypothetical protein Gogos_019100 [Gossypium gossypioides]|uniref:Uncharacterized protein n=1 Tax=Gossypium gossypioides TaxID=34282 RepID=A0A7J9BGD0_GOSGO|nr:hypothetical protein [Gossypium gossypioides]